MLSSEITKIVFDQLIRLKRNNEISLENIINFHESENNDNNILSIIEFVDNEYQLIIAIDDNKLVTYKEYDDDCIIIDSLEL